MKRKYSNDLIEFAGNLLVGINLAEKMDKEMASIHAGSIKFACLRGIKRKCKEVIKGDKYENSIQHFDSFIYCDYFRMLHRQVS